MSIQKRLLSKLNSIQITNDGNIPDILQGVGEAQKLTQEGLPEIDYVNYKEIYDGITMALGQVMDNQAAGETQEILTLCRDLLQHIVVQTTQEKNFKKEIFFLPYKASMWDSLESVWQAAHEDKEHCNAYVMPIPYCDRNPDGSMGIWHCERDQFPSYVPTLDWQEVDLEEWQPDIIFYHNPYDDYNRVTSVAPPFFSRNLKKYADKIIYIPYFVLGEPNIDYTAPEKAEEEEEKLANFIVNLGVINADYTIVQSEAMKKVYVNVLTRHTNAGRRYWENHILGLGSPKFDKVANSKKEDYELPEEWQKLINGRKTILYNTSISAMLEYSDKYLNKVRSVLETFKAQKDVVLWWRPHPLLRSTFQSMHPELLDEYDNIVNTYRREDWGIYDDTAELERAVAFTDGYYGDWSSVVQLYKQTGKLVMIQHVVDSEEEDVMEEAKKA